MKNVAISFVALLISATYCQAEPLPPHLANPGAGVKVHYVHLHGESAVKLFGDHAEFVKQIHQCQATFANSGVPIKIISDSEIPREVTPIDIYLYSGPHQSVAFTYTSAFAYSKLDCGITEAKGESRVITTAAGVCRINPAIKTAAGACDTKAGTPLPMFSEPTPRKPLGRKHIAGQQCDVYGQAAPIRAFTCMNHDGTFTAFPSAISGLLLKGIPLSIDSVFTKAEAVEVKFDIEVSPKLFSIPPEYKVNSKAPAR